MKMDASGRGDGREVQRGPGQLAGIQEEVPPPQEHIPPVSAGLGTRGGQSLFYANPGWLFNNANPGRIPAASETKTRVQSSARGGTAAGGE